MNRLDGIVQEPLRSKPEEPSCDDCGLQAGAITNSGLGWSPDEPLRTYSDGVKSCRPCANGTLDALTP